MSDGEKVKAALHAALHIFVASIVQSAPGAFEGGTTFFVFEDAAFYGGWAGAFAAAFEFSFLDGFFFGLFRARTEGFGQALAGESAVLGLRARVLDGDGDAGGDVAEGDFGGDFVDVLAAGAGGAVEVFFEVGFGEWVSRTFVH